MTNIHVNDAQAGIIKTALAEYAKSIREQARGYRGGYSAQAIELNVLRLNVEAVIEALERPAGALEGTRVLSIERPNEIGKTHAA